LERHCRAYQNEFKNQNEHILEAERLKIEKKNEILKKIFPMTIIVIGTVIGFFISLLGSTDNNNDKRY